LPARERDYVRKLGQAGEALLSLINDILDFSKIEAGRLTLERTSFSVEETLRKVSMMITTLQSGEVETVLTVSPGIPKRIFGDPLRVSQILLNLAGNAAKFTK